MDFKPIYVILYFWDVASITVLERTKQYMNLRSELKNIVFLCLAGFKIFENLKIQWKFCNIETDPVSLE